MKKTTASLQRPEFSSLCTYQSTIQPGKHELTSTKRAHSGTVRHAWAHSEILGHTRAHLDTLGYNQAHSGTLRHTWTHPGTLAHTHT